LVPEAGDTVQVMKAGLLEIADVFIVNKADREGADRMIGELQRMLHIMPEQAWSVPVLGTQASHDVGLAEVIDAIRAHRDHRKSEIEPERLRKARRREVYDIVEEELAARLRTGMDDAAFQDILGRVDRGESDPYGAAGEILQDGSGLSVLLAKSRAGQR
jgi:LAO/AO transport system kinase